MKPPKPSWPPSTYELKKIIHGPFDGQEWSPMFDTLDQGFPGAGVAHYDRHGEPITMRDWGLLRAIPEYKRVAETVVGASWISTVWTGFDMGFHPYTPVIIFETMVFGGERDQEQWRWATEEEARLGHEQVVQQIASEPTSSLTSNDSSTACCSPQPSTP